MYLTRMALNPARRGTRLLLASPQRMHAAVMCGFPPDSIAAEYAEGRILWRVDSGRDRTLLYVSSPTRPDLTHVVEQAGWPTAPSDPWSSVDTTTLLDQLTAGDRWIFRLTANPVRSVRPSGGGRGKPTAHVTVAQQEEWLRKRAPSLGFEPLRFDLVARRTATFHRRDEASSGKVTIGTATFDGALEITDPRAMRSALVEGVGRAKGYGCGLITLAPVS